MTQFIQSFIKKINSLNREDYESFEPMAIHALNKIQSECHQRGIYNVDTKINEMRCLIISGSTLQLLALQSRLLNAAEYIEQLIRIHEQDWEPGDLENQFQYLP